MELNGKPTKAKGVGRFVHSIVNNLMSRLKYARGNLDKRRDYYEEFGWVKEEPSVEQYQESYDRNPIAQRVVRVLPRECWKNPPEVYERDRNEITTPFEIAWKNLAQTLQISDPGTLNEVNFHQDQKGGQIWEVLRRADILSGIGRYGVLLLGFDDVTDSNPMSMPVAPGPRKLLFVNVFSENLCRISETEINKNSRRFGQPNLYTLTFGDPTDQQYGGTATTTHEVHWTRVIHLADNIESNSVFGVPRQRPVFNNLQDVANKLLGGSAEMYWQGAMPLTSFETDPSLGGDVDIDAEDIKDQWEQVLNGLQRVLALRGVTAKQLSPTVVSASQQIKSQMEAICIQLEIPVRIFLGSERGELASSQDDARWNDVVYDRQINYVSPRVIAPFINRLIAVGVLPKPSGYTIEWPDLSSQTAQEKARVSVSRTQAIVQYIKGEMWKVMALHDFLTRIMNFTDVEANGIIEANKEIDARWLMDPKSPPPNDLPNAKTRQSDIDRQNTIIGMNP